GETIDYTFTVENTGNATLTNITVSDTLVTVTGGPISLAPGAVDNSSFTASYTLTQSDVDNGKVTNQATATGTYTDGNGNAQTTEDLSDNDSNIGDDVTETLFTQNPAIALIKTGTFNDANGDGFAQVGETIDYTFTVENTGNATLTNITVSDTLVTVTGGPISLAPGAVDNSSFTASYTLTQSDVDNGKVTNQATATGTYTDGNGNAQTTEDLSDNDSNI
ncbi:DUF7507 domain-containing protein, partial [Mesonia oceanica]